MSRLSILALEPYYGGSHRAVLDGLVARIDADWTVLTLPARKWKWRMRGAAITMADATRTHERATGKGRPWDLVFASTFLNLAEFRGLAGPQVTEIPAIVYFHENQLVYPNRHTAEWDFQFPLTNITTALSAECCLFNSAWNLERFLAEIPDFLKAFPDHHPRDVVGRIAAKSSVLPPPFDPAPFDRALCSQTALSAPRGERPRVVWPHRWEHDKDPDAFFGAVVRLAQEDIDFEVAVAGQCFADRPAVFDEAAARLGSRLAHLAEPGSPDEYAALLAGADVAVSTAQNEFFGIAMIEAAYSGCYPLVPDRLAYPEIYPPEMRYGSPGELVDRLRALLTSRPRPGQARHLAEAYTYDALVGEYAMRFHEVAGV